MKMMNGLYEKYACKSCHYPQKTPRLKDCCGSPLNHLENIHPGLVMSWLIPSSSSSRARYTAACLPGQDVDENWWSFPACNIPPNCNASVKIIEWVIWLPASEVLQRSITQPFIKYIYRTYFWPYIWKSAVVRPQQWHVFYDIKKCVENSKAFSGSLAAD